MERSDYPTLAVLGVLTVVLFYAWAQGRVTGGPWIFHAGVLGAYGALLLGLARAKTSAWAWPARAAATVAVLHALYFTAGNLGLELTTRRWDEPLAGLDGLLLGVSPAYRETPGGAAGFEFFCLAYILFLPFIYSAIAAGCFSGSARARGDFLAGLALVYALSLPWHILLPAQGPRVLRPERFAGLMNSGVFHQMTLWLIERAGGPHGAFPSLHVGASSYCCFFELRHRPRVGWCYLPFVVLVALSGMLTGYHYAVDILAGAVIAGLAVRVTGTRPSS